MHVAVRLCGFHCFSGLIHALVFNICLCVYICLDYIAAPCSQEDEAHNVQSVIDSLSLDYLQISLSHITGIMHFHSLQQ